MNIDFNALIESGYLSDEALRSDTPSFDSAIIGVDEYGRLVYSFNKMINEFMQANECGEYEAIEFIEYNTLRALPYFGDMAPIIMYDISNYFMR